MKLALRRQKLFILLLFSLSIVLPFNTVFGEIILKDNNIDSVPAEDYLHGVYHVGIWVENQDEMLSFLSEIMDLKIVSRAKRASGGERLILSDPRGQQLELLSDPVTVRPHPDFPLHPRGRIAGVAHIAIQVEDIIDLKEKLVTQGYQVLGQAPKDFTNGYIVSEIDEHRILFVRGPSSVTFELFEIKVK